MDYLRYITGKSPQELPYSFIYLIYAVSTNGKSVAGKSHNNRASMEIFKIQSLEVSVKQPGNSSLPWATTLYFRYTERWVR